MEQIRKIGLQQRTDPKDLKGRIVVSQPCGDEMFICDVHKVDKWTNSTWVSCTYIYNDLIIANGEFRYDGFSWNGKIVNKDGSEAPYGIYAFVPSRMIASSNKL